MKKTNLYLTEQQIAALKKLSKSTGLPSAEHVRRALDDYLQELSAQAAQSTSLDSMTPAEQFDRDQDRPPNIHENGDYYVVAVWVESAGQYQAPLDAESRRLTGCHTEFARSLDGFAGLTLADAQSRATDLFGYEKLA